MLITLYILHEVNYDRSYPDSDRLYRAVITFNDQGNVLKGLTFQPPMAAAMKADFPEIEMAGRILPSPGFGAGSNQVSTEDNPESMHEDGFVYADQELLDMLKLQMVRGNRQHDLAEPNTDVIQASKAKRSEEHTYKLQS